MKKLRFFILSLLIAALIVSGCNLPFGTVSIKADELACSYLTGNNIGNNDYSRWTSPIYSYLVPTESGLIRIQGNSSVEGISVSYYDFDYNLIQRKTIAAELPLFGGFLSTDSAFFIVTGQANPEQKNDLEVYRITKYDKEWNRIGSCGLYGANTTVPFDAGSCRMDIDGQYLIIRTCHEMYKSADGYNHQANVTIEVDTSAMTVTDSYYIVMNSGVGYVSHSFNQFVKIENHSIVSVDHGDAHPRSICLMKYTSDITDGKFQSSVLCTDVMSFPGPSGHNTTGATVGGFEISDNNYLIAGSSVVQDEENLYRKTRNIFVAAVNKNTNTVTTKWLTDYSEGEISTTTPHMVKISGNSFAVVWSRGDKVYYTLIDENGNTVTPIYSMEGQLSDCVPVISSGKLIWYTWENGTEKFYEIPLVSPETPGIKTVSFDHEYERESISGSLVTLRCKKCGKTISGNVVSDFTMFWKKSHDAGPYWSYVPEDMQKDDEIDFLCSLDSGYTDEPEFSEMVIESNDPEHCITNWKDRTVIFSSGGKYTIKVYPKYYPEIAQSYSFVVNPIPTDTPTPTEKPTATPTPTEKPTDTPVPTENPTATPASTENPTDTPAPTENPTDTPAPTENPTNTPAPTDNPIYTPTPTDSPFNIPTDVISPTPAPTDGDYLTPTPSITPTPTTKINPSPKPTEKITPTPEIDIKINNGTSTSISFIKVNGKVSIEIEKSSGDNKVEKGTYTGIKSNKIRLDSFQTNKKTISIPKYIKANGKKYYITTIGKNVLGYSDCVSTVKLSSKITAIEANAFKNEKKLKRIEIQVANIQKIGNGAFTGIYKKAKIILIGTQEKCEAVEKLIRASGIGKKVKIQYNIK